MSGADKNMKNDLGRVCGDVLKMPGAMPGKRNIKCPIYAQGIIDKKGHKRDICPFLTTMPWAGNKYCGRSQRGKSSPF